jgi:hypothetical protein
MHGADLSEMIDTSQFGDKTSERYGDRLSESKGGKTPWGGEKKLDYVVPKYPESGLLRPIGNIGGKKSECESVITFRILEVPGNRSAVERKENIPSGRRGPKGT